MKTIKAIMCVVIATLGFGAVANNCATMSGTGATLYTEWNGLELSNSFSIGMWIKGMKAQYDVYAFYSHRVKLVVPNGKQQLIFSVTEAVGDDPANYPTESVSVDNWKSTMGEGSWHFYCCTFNYDAADSSKSFHRLYIDGQLKAEKTGADVKGPAAVPDSNRYVCIGGLWNSGHADWRITAGSVSEISIWNKALTTADAEILKGSRTGGFEDGLIVYWPFTGSTANSTNYAKDGVAATLKQSNASNSSFTIADDATFPLANCRCVVSPQWVETHGYTEPAGASYRNWTTPATNIQAAIDASCDGETIYVMKGTYPISETINLTKANTRVCSYDPDTTGINPAETVLDGKSRGQVMSVDGATDANIEVDGFTIKNGKNDSASGGGAYLTGKASSLAKLALRSRFSNCVFTNCVALNGGALKIAGGYVTNCTFVGCSATKLGGGVVFASSSYKNYNAYANRHAVPIAYDSRFVSCASSSRGGAVCDLTDYYGNAVLLEGCVFTNNSATTRGGCVCLGEGSWVRDCLFEGDSSAQYGACLTGPYVTVSNCVFRNLNSRGSYGVIHCSTGNSRYFDCVMSNVTANTDLIYLESITSGVLVRNSLLCQNNLGVSHVFYNNVCSGLTVENCTVAANTMSVPAVGYNSKGSAFNVFVNTIFEGIGIDAWEGNYRNVMSNCCVSARVTGDPDDSKVTVGSPRFVDAVNGDFTLKHGSPCRDNGLLLDWMSADSLDLAGNPRVVREGKSLAEDPTALPDMGCYECMLKASGIMLFVR